MGDSQKFYINTNKGFVAFAEWAYSVPRASFSEWHGGAQSFSSIIEAEQECNALLIERVSGIKWCAIMSVHGEPMARAAYSVATVVD